MESGQRGSIHVHEDLGLFIAWSLLWVGEKVEQSTIAERPEGVKWLAFLLLEMTRVHRPMDAE